MKCQWVVMAVAIGLVVSVRAGDGMLAPAPDESELAWKKAEAAAAADAAKKKAEADRLAREKAEAAAAEKRKAAAAEAARQKAAAAAEAARKRAAAAERVRQNAQAFSSDLLEVENKYLGFLAAGATEESLNSLYEPLKGVRAHARNLPQTVKVRRRGYDETLMWDSLFPHHLTRAWEEETAHPLPQFRADLERGAGFETKWFAKRCVELQLQTPGKHLSRKHGDGIGRLRDFKCHIPNVRALGGRNSVAIVQKWRDRILTSLFYYWSSHKGALWVQEVSREGTDPVVFAMQQAEDVAEIASAAFMVPGDSPIARHFERKIIAINDAALNMQQFMQKDGKKALATRKAFLNTPQLRSIWDKWKGKNDFLFYWAEVGVDDLPLVVEQLLDSQIPFGDKQTGVVRNLNIGPQNDREERLGGGNVSAHNGLTAPVNAFNREVLAFSSRQKSDILKAGRFKEDMVTFVYALAEFRAAAKAFQEAYSDGVGAVSKSGEIQRALKNKNPQAPRRKSRRSK